MPAIRGEWFQRAPVSVKGVVLDLERSCKQCLDLRADDEEGKQALCNAFLAAGLALNAPEPNELHIWVEVLNFIEKQLDVMLGVDCSKYCSVAILRVPKDDISDDIGAELDTADRTVAETGCGMGTGGDGKLDKEDCELTALVEIPPAVRAMDTKLVKAMLTFTAAVLKTSFNKEVYASANVSNSNRSSVAPFTDALPCTHALLTFPQHFSHI
jgi:hypothetical protein